MRRFWVQTLGCQMNVHDSQRISEVLEREGYARAEDVESASLIVVNTCSVREKAEHKLMSMLGTFKGFEVDGERPVVVVAGCVAQQEGERLLARSRGVDIVVGPDNIPELPALVRDAEGGAPPIARTVFDYDDPKFLTVTPATTGVSAFVTVMKGCDERCTYCIVPHTRGAERYRSADDILSEIQALVSGGVREITLLGQTVNSWYDPAKGGKTDRRDPSEFANLLRRVAEIEGLVRLRYTSPHPRHAHDALVSAHEELSVLARHVHLPVQSGSDRVLRRMARHYTRAEYLERAHALKAAHPDMTLSTDIIVGFPGETEEDFEDTLSIVREAGFVAAFAFKYSQRPFTPALNLDDDVTEAQKSDRLARLFAVVESQQTPHLKSLVGSQQKVLLEGPSRGTEGRFSGRTERNEIVHVSVTGPGPHAGSVVQVEITEAYRHSLAGRMDGAPLLEAPRLSRRLPVITSA